MVHVLQVELLDNHWRFLSGQYCWFFGDSILPNCGPPVVQMFGKPLRIRMQAGYCIPVS